MLGFAMSRRSPVGIGGGLFQRGEKPLGGLVIDGIAGALGERALRLAVRRAAHELAQGLSVDGCRGLLDRALLLALLDTGRSAP